MLNPTEIVATALGDHLAEIYLRAFGRREPRYGEIIAEAATLILEKNWGKRCALPQYRAHSTRDARWAGHSEG